MLNQDSKYNQMKNLKLIMLALFVLLTFVPMVNLQAMSGEPQSLPVTPLVVEGSNGFYDFDVELAVSQNEHAIGLMYRHEMADNHGMLFLHESVRFSSFWMKNTYISLDIIFVRFDGTISNIVANTIPLNLEPVSSTSPVLAVLELKAGQAARMGLRNGDVVFHEIFDNYPPEIPQPSAP